MHSLEVSDLNMFIVGILFKNPENSAQNTKS